MSNEEFYFEEWIKELVVAEFIISYELQYCINIFHPTYSTLADGTKILMTRKLDYCSDFKIIWAPKAKEIFFFTEQSPNNTSLLYAHYDEIQGYYFSLIDTKGSFTTSRNASDITFPIVQKVLYNIFNLYVQPIKPLCPKNGWFKLTFTPKSFLTTPKTNKPKKIKWEIKTLDNYVRDKSCSVN